MTTRTLKHRLLHLAAALSVVLCVATGVLWLRSLRWGDVVGWNLGERHGYLKSDEASLWLSWLWVPGDTGHSHFTRPGRRIDYENYIHTPIPALKWQASWFTAGHPQLRDVEIQGTTVFILIVPHWAMLLSLAAVATWSTRACWRSRRARARRERGRCIACGYDLRGTPGLCPECGMTDQQAGEDGAPPDVDPGTQRKEHLIV